MSKIIDFYQGVGTDAEGRTFYEALAMTDQQMEAGHHWIQWAFPLPEASKKQPTAPVATQDDLNILATQPVAKMRVLVALGRFIQFLDQTQEWRRPRDHNHLRITRVIRSLALVGHNDVAYEFAEYVKAVVGKVVGKEVIWYWNEALKRHPAWLTETPPPSPSLWGKDAVEHLRTVLTNLLLVTTRVKVASRWPPALRGVQWDDLPAALAGLSEEDVERHLEGYEGCESITTRVIGNKWQVWSPNDHSEGVATCPQEAVQMARRVHLAFAVADLP